MSRRATSCSLCSVAICTVVPPSLHGLEHGERRHGAGPPDVDVDVEQARPRLLGRELERHGPPGELGREPRSRRSARSSTLITTPSVSNPSDRRRVLPLAAEVDHRVDAAALAPVRLHRTSPRTQQFQHARMRGRRRCSIGGHDDLVGVTRAARAATPRRDPACGSRRPRRCADWRTRVRRRLRAPRSCARTLSAAGTPRHESRRDPEPPSRRGATESTGSPARSR